jgi:hypothetical protein
MKLNYYEICLPLYHDRKWKKKIQQHLEKYPIFTAPGLIIDEKLEFTGIPKITDLEKKFF